MRQQTRRLAIKVEHEKTVIANLPHLVGRLLEYARDLGRVTARSSDPISRPDLKWDIMFIVTANWDITMSQLA